MDEEEIKQRVRLIGPDQRAYAVRKVFLAPYGWVCTVRPPKRTNDQNDLFWEVMTDLSRAEPEGRRWTKETWRDAILHATGHAVQFEVGLEGAGAFPVGFRSSKLSVAQMSMCLDFAFAYGARHGVTFSIDRKRAAELFRGLAA